MKRIIDVSMPGGETESNRHIQPGEKLTGDHIRHRFKRAASGRAVVAGTVRRELYPFAEDNPRRSVEDPSVFQDRETAVYVLHVFAGLFQEEKKGLLQCRAVIRGIQRGRKG